MASAWLASTRAVVELTNGEGHAGSSSGAGWWWPGQRTVGRSGEACGFRRQRRHGSVGRLLRRRFSCTNGCSDGQCSVHVLACVTTQNQKTKLSRRPAKPAHRRRQFISGPRDLNFWPFYLRVEAYRATATHCMSTKFGLDSSSRFSFRARTHTDTDTQSQTPLIWVWRIKKMECNTQTPFVWFIVTEQMKLWV